MAAPPADKTLHRESGSIAPGLRESITTFRPHLTHPSPLGNASLSFVVHNAIHRCPKILHIRRFMARVQVLSLYCDLRRAASSKGNAQRRNPDASLLFLEYEGDTAGIRPRDSSPRNWICHYRDDGLSARIRFLDHVRDRIARTYFPWIA
jgi:hypothetical protein